MNLKPVVRFSLGCIVIYKKPGKYLDRRMKLGGVSPMLFLSETYNENKIFRALPTSKNV